MDALPVFPGRTGRGECGSVRLSDQADRLQRQR
jgi:hypothetical protein